MRGIHCKLIIDCVTRAQHSTLHHWIVFFHAVTAVIIIVKLCFRHDIKENRNWRDQNKLSLQYLNTS